jgi:hypothetical protein
MGSEKFLIPDIVSHLGSNFTIIQSTGCSGILLLELTEANLSEAVQWLNVSYSAWFNRRHGRCGHLFQGQFKSVAVSPENGVWR